MSWLFPSHKPNQAIEDRISDAMLAGDEAKNAIRKIVASSEAERANADELADSVRQRLALIEARRSRRIQDPRISVVVETLRILQGRP